MVKSKELFKAWRVADEFVDVEEECIIASFIVRRNSACWVQEVSQSGSAPNPGFVICEGPVTTYYLVYSGLDLMEGSFWTNV